MPENTDETIVNLPKPDKITPSKEEIDSSIVLTKADLQELKAQFKSEILNELKDETTKKMELERQRREEENQEYLKYVEKMKASKDPWVDIIGWVRSANGVEVQLDWNDSFVDYLRANGITGVDNDTIVQKWIAILLRDMAENMDEQFEGDSDFAG